MGGLLDGLSEGIAWVLAFFYGLIPSYGVSIILLTLAVMIVLTPLTLKGTRSMMAMQQLQPDMKKIQTQYKDDREKLNEELLKFYKENNINPLGGCLPLLVQMPVFLVLFQVLRGLTRRESDLGTYSGWATGLTNAGETLVKPPDSVTERVFDPAFLDPSSKMYEALSGSYEMNFLGIDLSESASQALSEGVVHAIPYLVLILLVAFTGWFQQRQIQGRNPAATQNPQQQMIMKLMPILLPVISFSLPGGLVLYFLVSNGYRIGQQAWITRTLYTPDGPVQLGKGGSGPSDDPKGPDKGPKDPDSPSKGPGKAKKSEAKESTNGNGAAPSSARTSPGKGRTTPKRGQTPPAKAPSRRTGSGTSKSAGRKAKKTYTSDPKARGRGTSAPQVEPRGRKAKKKKD
jgi:YidC/Oxa1 family membrane protein insertase